MTKRELEAAVQALRLEASAVNKIIGEQSENIKWFSRETDSLRAKIVDMENANKKLSAELSALHRAIADDFILRVKERKDEADGKMTVTYRYSDEKTVNHS